MPGDALEIRAHVEARLLGLKLLWLDALVLTEGRRDLSRVVLPVDLPVAAASDKRADLGDAIAMLDKSSRALAELSGKAAPGR